MKLVYGESKKDYRKLMYYNNVWNSSERRLGKRVVVEQEENSDVEGSFFGTVKGMAESIDVVIDDLKSLPKSQLKKLIKKKLNERMKKVISATIPRMKKLRFIEDGMSAQLGGMRFQPRLKNSM